MHLISFVPGLLIGLWYAVQYGNWMFFFAVSASVLIALLTRRPGVGAPEVEVDQEGRLRIEGRVLSRVPIFWSRLHRDAVFRLLVSPTFEDLKLAIESASETSRRESRLLLGVTRSLSPVTIVLSSSSPHLLIIGPTGAGKSVLMRALAERAQPLLDIDFKGGDNLAEFLAMGRLSNLDSAQHEFWDSLNTMIDQREAQPRQPHSALYVFVDELAAVLASSTAAAKTLERVATRGRSSSIFLIVASQSTAGIPRNIILNCQHRILLGAVDPVDRTQLGARGTRAAFFGGSDQLTGEYLFQGEQTEFIMLKPPSSSNTPPVARLTGSNPLQY